MTIYVVTTGDYSDYHICGVFTDKAKAERMQELAEADSIEEWEADKMPDVPEGMRRWYVIMRRDGQAVHVNTDSVYSDSVLKDAALTYGKVDEDGSLGMRFEMFAHDEKHAVKIANERRAQLIAMNQWPQK